MKIFPIGDTALTIEFGNLIDEKINAKVLALFESIRDNKPAGVIEAVPAYSSLTVYYDVFQLSKIVGAGKTVYDHVREQVEAKLSVLKEADTSDSRLMEIPVCYEREFGPDIEEVAAKKGLSFEEVIDIHRSREYRVYMLGFLPGFNYMAEVDERIVVPRKSQPKPVAAGSIGIAGKQTGIYPLSSPGGWHIIGRTPVKLFDPGKEEQALFKAGDRVRFIPISKNEFENY